MCIIYKCKNGENTYETGFWSLTTWWQMRKGNTHRRSAAGSAGVHQTRHEVTEEPVVPSLGVSDGAVLLSEMKPQLTLVSEVEVTFFTLEKKQR